MKIKIIKCNNKLLWHFKHMGEIFEVVRQDSEYYWAYEKNLAWRCVNIIPKEDAIEVNELTGQPKE